MTKSIILCLLRSVNAIRWIAGLFILTVLLTACPARNQLDFAAGGRPRIHRPWQSWNILFFPNYTRPAQKAQVLDSLKNSILDYIRAFDQLHSVNDSAEFLMRSCLCDSSLENLETNLLIDSSGEPVPVPKTPPSVGPQGDYVVGNNDTLSTPINTGSLVNASKVALGYAGGTDTNSAILAILDTGIDTTLFSSDIKYILWKGKGKDTLNFLLGKNPADARDRNSVRHGSTVAALALETFYKRKFPRLMALKVLDDKGVGNVFTVSCGLRFAKQHHAAVINASLGYYDSVPDIILKHYVAYPDPSTGKAPPLIVAAGNEKDAQLAQDSLCSYKIQPGNLLSNGTEAPKHLFYPACFQDKSVTVVTGISHPNAPCYYQNYSSDYVSVGVLNDSTMANSCCEYRLPYLQLSIEGSSFATPVYAGYRTFILMNHIPDGQAPPLTPNIKAENRDIPTPPALNGHYIIYSGKYLSSNRPGSQ